MGIEIFEKHLREKRAIKISAGSNNLNLETVAKVCKAAQMSRASAVEITCSKEVYNIARKNTKLPLFVSSIHPFEILDAVKMGIDAVIIGNYFETYKKGQKFSASEIYDIVLETMGLINNYDVYIAVTIPASITFEEQVELVKKLEVLGVNLIQTEGYKKSSTNPNAIIESAEFSIKNLEEIRKITRVPIIASCAMNETATKAAFEKGAYAVSIDSYVNKLDYEAAMKAAILNIFGSISYRISLNKELIRNSRELSINNL